MAGKTIAADDCHIFASLKGNGMVGESSIESLSSKYSIGFGRKKASMYIIRYSIANQVSINHILKSCIWISISDLCVGFVGDDAYVCFGRSTDLPRGTACPNEAKDEDRDRNNVSVHGDSLHDGYKKVTPVRESC